MRALIFDGILLLFLNICTRIRMRDLHKYIVIVAFARIFERLQQEGSIF